jgi:hypothetical protein
VASRFDAGLEYALVSMLASQEPPTAKPPVRATCSVGALDPAPAPQGAVSLDKADAVIDALPAVGDRMVITNFEQPAARRFGEGIRTTHESVGDWVPTPVSH